MLSRAFASERWPSGLATFAVTPGGFIRTALPRAYDGHRGLESRKCDLGKLIPRAEAAVHAVVRGDLLDAARQRTRFLIVVSTRTACAAHRAAADTMRPWNEARSPSTPAPPSRNSLPRALPDGHADSRPPGHVGGFRFAHPGRNLFPWSPSSSSAHGILLSRAYPGAICVRSDRPGEIRRQLPDSLPARCSRAAARRCG